ncbi:MAG: acyltransferase family protein [Micromonosporaceae bacterium]|nr:acyltransferase family protein [Micromonosporaceae bacterium]
MGPRRALRTASRRLDTMVAGTPEHRDRYVDLLRVLAIGVVVAWHWSLSILYWSGDRWVMPNPIHHVPGGWLATWLLQIVPVFFVVGGYANSAAWWAAQRAGRDGRGWAGYYRARLRRLLVPIGAFLAVWAGFELVAHLVVPGYPGVLRYGWIVFTPLWFILAYLWVVLLAPVTATAHSRARWLTLSALAAAVGLADLGRFAAGVGWLAWLNTALVWVLIHQLGYFYRDGTLARLGRPGAVALAAAGVVALALLTRLPAYPLSMVATVGQERSNILPATATIAAVAVLQLGVIMWVREPVTRWLRRPRAWKPVVAASSVIMTVFLWHMTALLVVLAALRVLGVDLRSEPTARWWLERPLWLAGPGVVLVLLVLVFARFERAGDRGTLPAGGAPLAQ